MHHFLRSLFGLVFVGAGSVKLLDITTFASRLGDFGIVLDPLVPAAAWVISLTEVAIGVGLLINLRGSLVAALTLLTLFLGVLTYGVALGLDIDCGCWGPAFSVGLRTQLLMDLGLLGCGGLVYLTGRRRHGRATGPDAGCELTVPEGESR